MISPLSRQRLLLGLLLLPLSGALAAPPSPAVVTPQTIASTPISPLLYSNFIELGYGIQVEPMWAEMLFNRSFEAFVPYREINVSWYDLWNNPKDHKQGFKDDWRGEDWYHSGYEHNPWFPAPGVGGVLPIDAHSTFFINKSNGLDVELLPQPGGSGHGTQCLRVINREKVRPGGLAQEGKFLHRGESYLFRGKIKNSGALPVSGGLEVRLYREGAWDKPIASVPLHGITGDFTPVTAAFEKVPYEGRATFALWLPPGADLTVDGFSLMPAKTVGGWRPEVVKELAKIKPGVIRFPGGCFASFYDWRDGVGPYSQRKPQPSYFWGGFNYNDVGTDEYAALCEAIGSKMMMCVNLFHSSKEEYSVWVPGQAKHGYHFPQFTNLDAGAKLAADWVAYCNLPAGTHPMADLRAKNGHPWPYGAQFWEMDNETFRWFTPEEYAKAVVVYSKAMKAVDPSIQIGMVTYGNTFAAKIPQMLEIAGKDVDFLADRGARDEILKVMREFNAQHGTKLRCANTEWLPYNAPPDEFNNIKEEGVSKSYLFSKWAYAMNIFRAHLEWQRKGEEILFVNFNNLANTHSQCAIDTPKEGAYLTASGKAFELLANSPAAWPLTIENYTAKPKDSVQIQVCWDNQKERAILFLFNMTDQPVDQEFDLKALGKRFATAESTELWADSLVVMNNPAHPDAIHREVRAENVSTPGKWMLQARPFSFTQVVLTPQLPPFCAPNTTRP